MSSDQGPGDARRLNLDWSGVAPPYLGDTPPSLTICHLVVDMGHGSLTTRRLAMAPPWPDPRGSMAFENFQEASGRLLTMSF